jgi:transcriptional regulator with XRE-family HTH domain
MVKNNVKVMREERGLSQIELARLACVATSNLSDVEHGRRQAWPILRKRLARALKTSEDSLFPADGGQDAG